MASLGEYLSVLLLRRGDSPVSLLRLRVLLLLQLRLLGMSRLLHVHRMRLPSGWLMRGLQG